MAFWHGRVLTATYFFRDRGIVVMISENFDGEWIARIIERFGYGTSRGSTSRGGQRALLQLKRDMDERAPAGFTVDGPRGPARVVQPGAVWLAKLDRESVVPVSYRSATLLDACAAGTARRFPKPFTTVVAGRVGEPIAVPPDARRGRLRGEACASVERTRCWRSSVARQRCWLADCPKPEP